MNFTDFFIRRAVTTTLIMVGILLFGILSYTNLPVSELPQVEYPTIQVSASLPGANPDTMASSVATPLEKQFSTISGVELMTSSSSLGSTGITLQFDLNRSIDAAAQDVEAAIAKHTSTLDQFRAAIRAIVDLNARSPQEQRLILNDLTFLGEDDQQTIKSLERRIVDLIAGLVLQLDNNGKIVKRTKKVYTMMLFGTLNFSHTWYDPKGGIGPAEFADMVVDQFLHGIASPVASRHLATSASART